MRAAINIARRAICIAMSAEFLRLHVLFAMAIACGTGAAQDLYDIKFSEKDHAAKCSDCVTIIQNKPQEIQYGIYVDEIFNMYFIVTQRSWFDQLFKKFGDGIAVDIVHRDRYSCTKEAPDMTGLVKGDLQRPYYLHELKQNKVPGTDAAFVTQIGRLPQKYIGQEVEFNIVILKDKFFCYYNNFYDIQAYRWDLLDMGLYFDTLTYRTHQDTALSAQESFILQNKVMRFEIPFEKNKADYSPSDLRPLYDSLRLTDFNIRKISIRAYSSIEGNEARNLQLQQERANSIVSALQSFQSPSIITEIQASENWVDFLNDIGGTPYAEFADLSKPEIKEKLKDTKITSALEPYLQQHRRAVILLELEKKDRYADRSAEELVELFANSIQEKNLEKAIEIQNSIFMKVRDHEMPVHLLDRIDIPRQRDFSLLLNKRTIFRYLMDPAEIFTAYNELNELRDLIPTDGHIRYNICALKFRIWLLGESAIDPGEFKKEIQGLGAWGIKQDLITRMLINYEIIMSELHMMKGDFASKDKSLKYIKENFRSIPDSDMDHLSLAQYFASYARYDWAIGLLKDKVKEVNVHDDLLFYYLNLTLVDEELTKEPAYRTTMLNAFAKDRDRYCSLFKPFGKGGITFQLLDNEYLRKTYCENCDRPN